MHVNLLILCRKYSWSLFFRTYYSNSVYEYYVDNDDDDSDEDDDVVTGSCQKAPVGSWTVSR